MSEIDPAWREPIARAYLSNLVKDSESELYEGNAFQAVANTIWPVIENLYASNNDMTTEDLALELYQNFDLRQSIADQLNLDDSDDFMVDLPLGWLQNTNIDITFMPEVGGTFTDWDKAPSGSVQASIDQQAVQDQSIVSGTSNWTRDFESYVAESARVNELVMVPEIFRQGQTLRNLQQKGWIRKLVPRNESQGPSAIAIALTMGAEDSDDDLVAETEQRLEGFERSADQLAGGVMADESAYWVFTELATDGFNDWLATVFTAEELMNFYDANGITSDQKELTYDNLLAMTDLISSNFTSSDRAELIYNLTGDETISPENAFMQLSNGMHIAENDVDLISQFTQFSRSQIKRIAEKTAEKHEGLDSSILPWQIIALAIEQANDYQDDDTDGLITENINLGVKKFSKYVEEYEKALNLYTDGETTHYELAYLHLLSPDLAQKIMNGGHDQLTVGEVNFINSSFNTIDTFHNRTGQFSPGWSTNMSTKNWLQGLSPGRMTDSYLTEAQIETIKASGDIDAIVAAGTVYAQQQAQKEEDDLAQLDQTKKDVAKKTYSDLYKEWFLDDPTEVELDRFMGWWAGKEADYRREVASWSPFTSGQYNNPNDITDSTLLSQRTALSVEESLKNDPRYAQLYGRKPTGMSESEYGQVFSTQAMADYGQSGMLNKGLIKKGMASGDTGDITREGILTGEGYDNSQYMKKIMTLRNAVRRST